MKAHKTQAIIGVSGKLELSNLPFDVGSQVEIIVLEREEVVPATFQLRGTNGVMHDPVEPLLREIPDDEDIESEFEKLQADNPLKGLVLHYDRPFDPV
jgi:hypothetical protein